MIGSTPVEAVSHGGCSTDTLAHKTGARLVAGTNGYTRDVARARCRVLLFRQGAVSCFLIPMPVSKGKTRHRSREVVGRQGAVSCFLIPMPVSKGKTRHRSRVSKGKTRHRSRREVVVPSAVGGGFA